MNKEHVKSDEPMQEILHALANAENWIAYNTNMYFLDAGDAYFFKAKDDAYEFANNNISDHDSFKVIHFNSVADLLLQISYGTALPGKIDDPDANGLYSRDGNDFTDALIDHWEKEQIINNKKHTVMNDKNFEYLKDNIKYLGFGEKLYPELEKNMQQGQPEFQLSIETEFNKDKIGAVLHFKKSDNNDMYFFNRYDANMEKANKEQLSQTIYLNKGQGITMKETYNMLNGRAVNTDMTTKEGQKYNAWVQLDLSDKDANGNYKTKQFHQNYGYDLEATLQKYPIKELIEPKEKEGLLSSLQRGNLQIVTFEKEGRQEKLFIEASPQWKTINVYDGNMQRIQSQALAEKYGQQHGMHNGKEISAKEETKKEMQKNNNDDTDEGPKNAKKQSRKRKQSIS